MASKKPSDHGTGIPLYEVEALTRALFPEIQRFFESEEGQKEFRERKSGKTKMAEQRVKKTRMIPAGLAKMLDSNQ